ncbi:Hypp5393 [Branchiostoma lanceolatum]|uniref:Hypp5393 protein n=1 Tax=Branchiostoma lanceolatum TaxID=7740 RepID=A0A8K0F3R8_BRALA|nr:Hypp5393 [Branchiostoma lanceolatum]
MGQNNVELYDIFNRSAESVRLRIQPRDFPLTVMQCLTSEQEVPCDEESREGGISQRRVHPVKKLMKRPLRLVTSVLSRICKALVPCGR